MQGKRHEPTEETRKLVRHFSACGVRQEEIAAYLEIQRQTLAKHYRRELDTASTERNAQIAQRLFDVAMGGNITGLIFWLKSRAGWRDNGTAEVEATDNGLTINFVEAPARETTPKESDN